MAPNVVPNHMQIQSQSYGIKPDLDAPGWHICYFTEDHVNARDEEYYFPCSNDKQCCGRECCSPVTGFPAWLAWLIGILVFLLLLLLLLCLLYYCLKYCRTKKRPAPPSPRPSPVMVYREPPRPGVHETYRRLDRPESGVLRHASDSNLIEIRPIGHEDGVAGLRSYTPSTNTMTTVVSVAESRGGSSRNSSRGEQRRPPRRTRSHRRRRRGGDWFDDDDDDEHESHFREPPFVPSPMHESYESSPTPIRISYHDESEITQERRPLVRQVQPPDEQKARTVFYRPGSDRVAAYNEMPK